MTTTTVTRQAQDLRDRRRHPRVRARGMATHIQTREAMTGGLIVENISMGGLFVRTASALPLGMPVTVQIVRPGLKRAIRMTGRVVSVVPPAVAGMRGAVPGMGIGIDPLDGDTEQRLRALVESLTEVRRAA